MKIDLFPKGNFYKANLHCHTVLSDGSLEPEQMKEHYKNAGYSVVAFTDHRRYAHHKELDDNGFIALAAFEVDINEDSKEGESFSEIKTYHINLFDTCPEYMADDKARSINPERRFADADYINSYLKRMKEIGFLACLNHPYWSLQKHEDYKDITEFWAMEIYNYGCEIDGLYGYNPQAYDEMLRLGNKLYCLSTDDNHNSYPFGHELCDSFGGFTMIKTDDFSYGGIINALKNGSFYSSMGPKIYDLYIEDMCLYIKTDPCKKIYVKQRGRHCYYRVAGKDQALTDAVFELKGTEGYIRITIQDEKGLKADTNAIFLEDIFRDL